jgi:hypothetical protein
MRDWKGKSFASADTRRRHRLHATTNRILFCILKFITLATEYTWAEFGTGVQYRPSLPAYSELDALQTFCGSKKMNT